jgi:hypothetical protein
MLIAELGYKILISWCDCLPTYDLLCICDNNNFQSEGVDTTLATMFVAYFFHRRSVLVAHHLHERQHSSNAYRRVCSMSQWTNRSQIARFLSWQKFICSCLTDGSTCMLLSLRHRTECGVAVSAGMEVVCQSACAKYSLPKYSLWSEISVEDLV